MELKGYEVKEKRADGSLYVVVQLSDGSTFGQLVHGVSTVEDLDAFVEAAAERVSASPVLSPEVDALVGTYRSLEEGEVTKEVSA